MIKREQQLDYWQLQNNQDIKNIFAIEVKNRFSVLEQEGNNTTWKKQQKKPFQRKRNNPKMNGWQMKYSEWCAEGKLYTTKEQWWIQTVTPINKKKMQRRKRRMVEEWMCRNRKRKINKHKTYAQENKRLDRCKKTCSSSGCIRSKDGTLITEKDDILERWTEYIEELFRDNRGGKPEIRKNIDGPKILQSEIPYVQPFRGWKETRLGDQME